MEGGTELKDDHEMEEDHSDQEGLPSIDDGNGHLSDANVSGLDSDFPLDSQESPSDEADVDDDIFDEEAFESGFSNWTRYRWTWILKPATAANEKNQPPR